MTNPGYATILYPLYLSDVIIPIHPVSGLSFTFADPQLFISKPHYPMLVCEVKWFARYPNTRYPMLVCEGVRKGVRDRVSGVEYRVSRRLGVNTRCMDIGASLLYLPISPKSPIPLYVVHLAWCTDGQTHTHSHISILPWTCLYLLLLDFISLPHPIPLDMFIDT